MPDLRHFWKRRIPFLLQGGSTGIETCTVEILTPSISKPYIYLFAYQNCDNDTISTILYDGLSTLMIELPCTLNSVPCNSYMVIEYGNIMYNPTLTGGITYIGESSGVRFYHITSNGSICCKYIGQYHVKIFLDDAIKLLFQTERNPTSVRLLFLFYSLSGNSGMQSLTAIL